MSRVRALAQKCIYFTHLRGRLESIALRRILQLLVKVRDRASQLRAIRDRANQIVINGVRLPYLKFPRNPTD